MKTLVFHGYGQSAAEAETKWAGLFEKIGLAPVYLEAPLAVINRKGESGRGWFTWKPITAEIYLADRYSQIDETLEYIDEFIKSNGPFSVMLGYSQGGTILSLYLDRYPSMVENVIIISSYNSNDPKWTIDHRQTHPTMVVMGSEDDIVPIEYTQRIYERPDRVYLHKGGHAITTNRGFIDAVRSFLRK